jgi:serine/threonine protein kinase
MASIFLSYSHTDVRWRDLVRAMLQHVGESWRVEVFIDESLPAGTDWEPKLKDAVQTAEVFVALVSKEWCKSTWSLRELEWAMQGKAKITWIAIDRADPPDELRKRNAALPLDEPLIRFADDSRFLQQQLTMAANRILEHLDPLRAELSRVLPSKYALLESFFDGGLSSVFTALDRTLGRRVIVRAVNDSKNNALFDTLVRGLAKLDRHPAFPVLYGAWFDRDPHCCVAEYIEGATLAEELRASERRWRVEEAVRFICLLGDGLVVAHQAGLEHGDLRPSKIRVTSHKEAFITGRWMHESEFGAENIWDVLQRGDPGAVRERLAYVAPEHFDSLGAVSVGKTDQYLLGLILYHLIRHSPPQTIANVEEVRQRRYPRFVRLPLLSEVDPECPETLARIVAKMTEHTPQERYGHLGDALEEIRRCLPIHLALVEESVSRLTAMPAHEDLFFGAFYARLSENPEVKAVFEARLGPIGAPSHRQSWSGQHRKLKESVLALVAYARRAPTSEHTNPLRRVAEAHAHVHKIKAEWYGEFVDAFVATVREREEAAVRRHVPHPDKDRLTVVEQAWRQTLQAGIRYMISHGVDPASGSASEADATPRGAVEGAGAIGV